MGRPPPKVQMPHGAKNPTRGQRVDQRACLPANTRPNRPLVTVKAPNKEVLVNIPRTLKLSFVLVFLCLSTARAETGSLIGGGLSAPPPPPPAPTGTR